MKKIRRLLCAVLIFAMVFTFAPRGQADEQVTITFALWDEVQSVVYQQLIDNFEAQNPNIKVKMQLTPWDQYWTKFQAAAGTSEMPDTFFMNPLWEIYLTYGFMEPLNDWVERDGLDMSVYNSALVQYFTSSDGTLACMPKGMDSIAVAVNSALFEKYGVEIPDNDWTWEEMLEICQQLKTAADAAGDNVYPMGMALNSVNSSWAHVMAQFGGKLFVDGQPQFNSPENVEAFTNLVDMIDKGYMPDYVTISDTAIEEMYISGMLAMLYLPTFSSQTIEQSNMEGTVLVTLPKAKTSNGMLGGMGYGMSAYSAHKEEAWTFLKYLGSEEANEIIGKSGIDMPAMTSMQPYYGQSFTKFDGAAYALQLQNAEPLNIGSIMAANETGNIYSKYVMQIFSGEIGVEEALEAIDTEIIAVLAEY